MSEVRLYKVQPIYSRIVRQGGDVRGRAHQENLRNCQTGQTKEQHWQATRLQGLPPPEAASRRIRPTVGPWDLFGVISDRIAT